jgi:hypothetical protein
LCVSAAAPRRLQWRSRAFSAHSHIATRIIVSRTSSLQQRSICVNVNFVCVQVERVRNELTKRIAELESALAAERSSRSDSNALHYEIESYKAQVANYANEVSKRLYLQEFIT